MLQEVIVYDCNTGEKRIEWREVADDLPIPPLPYEVQVVQLIRERYTVDDELALHRQREEKPEEFAAYFTYCEQCKATIRAQTEGQAG